MNQDVVKYLQNNKNRQPQEESIRILGEIGYGSNDINEELAFVYQNNGLANKQQTGFWDFNSKKIYSSGGEKVVDFFSGLLVPWIVFLFLLLIPPLVGFLIWLAIYISLLSYLFCKRTFIVWGLFVNMILNVLLILILIFYPLFLSL